MAGSEAWPCLGWALPTAPIAGAGRRLPGLGLGAGPRLSPSSSRCPIPARLWLQTLPPVRACECVLLPSSTFMHSHSKQVLGTTGCKAVSAAVCRGPGLLWARTEVQCCPGIPVLRDQMCYLESHRGDGDNLHGCNSACTNPRQHRHLVQPQYLCCLFGIQDVCPNGVRLENRLLFPGGAERRL